MGDVRPRWKSGRQSARSGLARGFGFATGLFGGRSVRRSRRRKREINWLNWFLHFPRRPPVTGAFFPCPRLTRQNMNTQIRLDQVRVASPCHARWEDMAGDDRSRFCGQCRKSVFNFSAMTRAEVETLIREKEGRLCARFYQRPDGRMLTADCPVGSRRRWKLLARWSGTAFAALTFILSGCSSRREPRVMGEIAAPRGSRHALALAGRHGIRRHDED